MIKFYLLSVIFYTTVLGQIFRSDYTYYEQVGGWLKFHSIPAVWNNARLRCQAEGGVLASPLKEDLASIMIALMKTEKVNEIFTGIHATYSKGSYASVEGVRLREILGIKGKPDIDNRNNAEDCLIMYQTGSVADVRCQNVYQYICYKKYDPHMAEPKDCGTTDTAYSYSEVTGHCYKFHSYGQPWDLAHMICDAEGGYLAIINSESEAQVMRDIFAKYASNAIVASRVKDGAHLGFKADPENNVWTTIHGQSLKDAGYANWDGGQPDNYTDASYVPRGGQNCGNMFRNGRLDDNFCSVNAPFICEKHHNSLHE